MALHDGEGLEDVVRVVGSDAVEVEEGRVELAAEGEAALSFPDEGLARIGEVPREGLEGMGGGDELEHPRPDPDRNRPNVLSHLTTTQSERAGKHRLY